MFSAHLADALQFREFPTGTPALVHRILDGHEPRIGEVRVFPLVDALTDLGGGEPAVVALEESHGCAGVEGYATSFIEIDVSQLIANDLVPRLLVKLVHD